jgi:hypothetical protein
MGRLRSQQRFREVELMRFCFDKLGEGAEGRSVWGRGVDLRCGVWGVYVGLMRCFSYQLGEGAEGRSVWRKGGAQRSGLGSRV